MRKSPVICPLTLAEISGGNVLLEHELLELFLATTQQGALSLEEAFAERSLDRVDQVAHLINGRSRVLGALFLARACQRMERLARSGNWAGLERAYGRFREEWAAVREAVQRMRS